MKKNSTKKSLLGAVILFVTVAVVVTATVIIYDFVSDKVESKGAVAAIMLAVIVVFSGVCTAIDYLRRKYTVERTVEKILLATQKIASGDFSVKLDITHPYSRYDEYDQIMDNLNRMTAELSKTEVLHGDFVSNVSHEIKTPVAVINTYAKLLASDGVDSEKKREYAQTIIDACQRLTALVGNILKLNKLENQQLALEYESIDLSESLAECILGFEQTVEQKNIDLQCDLDSVTALSCREYLEIVWNNLISNAVKFTEDGGTVTVTLKEQDGKAVVKISDTGCGISAETGAHIFDKFYQGDTSHSKEGNGLGLPLVKKVIDIIGGEISVESEVGKGSTFTVKIKR